MSLHFGCRAPDFIEQVAANSLPPRVAICHGGTYITSDNFPAQKIRCQDSLALHSFQREPQVTQPIHAGVDGLLYYRFRLAPLALHQCSNHDIVFRLNFTETKEVNNFI